MAAQHHDVVIVGGGLAGIVTALEALRQEEGVKGLVVDGRHFDTGIPTIYAETLAHFSKSE